jgi:hypothetical protein
MSRMDKSTAFFSPSFMGLYIYNSLSIIQRKKKRKKTMGRVSLEKPSFFSMGFNNSVYPFICIYDPRAELLCVHFFRLCCGWRAVPLYFGPLLAAMRARAGIIDIFPI